MKHTYRAMFEPTSKKPLRAIKALVAAFPGVTLDADLGEIALSEDGDLIRKLFERAVREGFQCSVVSSTQYTREDALLGEFGLLVGAGSDRFQARLPKDAFDLSTACRRCGLGGVQAKPYVMAKRSIQCKGPFYIPDPVLRIIMRTEIWREVVQAVGSKAESRHPVTIDGDVIREWTEPVPTYTMPPLSRKSEGVVYPERCPVCERVSWDHAADVPTRLVYSRAACKAAQAHAVIAMHEGRGRFPDVDPKTGRLKNYYGQPQLLFNRKAVEVLAKYIEPEKRFPASSIIMPVFAE